jgi:catechol 2,3-dioxygenase-like lactoylglutathione lyase family enzyme
LTDTPRPSHLGLCVRDLDRSLRFYCNGLGFEIAEGYDLDDTSMPGLSAALEVSSPVALRSQMIRHGVLTIELLAYSVPTPSGTPSASRGALGLTHLAFHVHDVDAAVARLVECGGTAVPTTNVTIGVRLAFVGDPDGTRIELMAG